MKSFIVFVAIVAAALAAPVDDSKDAVILKYENDNIGVDGYKFAYETSDGVSRSEEAELKNPGTEQEALSVRGTITWIAADGVQYTLNYIADENGFQPQGDHLPKV
ncbi:endocuticle structural protein SgAbd-6-like [Bradysia coprophila]|uniref:endocuticle structural protein SgAbd-6-like n=1 Tax=Bradysia coprophila TaxID=38358 RepID=UPI00187DA18D|nr:endocuticle structural protein SgAbd-6-like [Bradysia coprophila]